MLIIAVVKVFNSEVFNLFYILVKNLSVPLASTPKDEKKLMSIKLIVELINSISNSPNSIKIDVD